MSIHFQDKDGQCTRCGSRYGWLNHYGPSDDDCDFECLGCRPPDDPAKVEIMLIGASTAENSFPMEDFLAELAELVATAEPNQEAIDELNWQRALETQEMKSQRPAPEGKA